MDISRELVDPCDGSCEPPSRLVHSRPSEESSFSRRLEAQEKKRLIMDMFYGNSIQDHKIKARLQSTKYVFCVCFQGTLAETILQPLPFLHVLIAVAQL